MHIYYFFKAKVLYHLMLLLDLISLSSTLPWLPTTTRCYSCGTGSCNCRGASSRVLRRFFLDTTKKSHQCQRQKYVPIFIEEAMREHTSENPFFIVKNCKLMKMIMILPFLERRRFFFIQKWNTPFIFYI